MSRIIFYFSGTGNSYAVSELIAEKIGGARLASILDADNYPIEDYQIVGFVFPVYYTHAPEAVIKALSNMKFQSSQQVFLIAAFAGSWGYALQDGRKALEKNNVSIQEYKVRMPGNYILEYGAFPACYQRHILHKAEKSINEIAIKINKKSKTEKIKPNLLARLSKQNADKQRKLFKELGSKFYCLEQCSLCSQCVNICPADNIIILDNKVFWGSKCEQCMACIQWCPQKAITHPALKKKRQRYTHPNVSVQQLQRGK